MWFLKVSNIKYKKAWSDKSGEKTENKYGHSDGWISGQASDYRPDYWGIVEGKDWDGNSGAIVWHQGGAE